MKLYCDVAEFAKAAEVAYKHKSLAELNEIRSKCPSKEMIQMVDGYIVQLSTRR